MTLAAIAAVTTGTTCGFACWEAREPVCRCSCGGKNHGILARGGPRPERTCQIKGSMYRLAAVGNWLDIRKAAYDYNVPGGDYNKIRLGWAAAIDKSPTKTQRHWPEVVNSGIEYSQVQLLWMPVSR